MKISVLIVDDSEVYRIFLRSILSTESDIEIVSVASNGRLALPRIKHYQPDVVLLDYQMPEMDGLETIPEIKNRSPHSRILMFSSHTTRGAQLTLQALELGADDFITKPAGNLGGDVAAQLKVLLLDRIRGLTTKVVKDIAPAEPLISRRAGMRSRYRYCVIGISTGGPPALRRLFKAISPDIRGSIFVVQHMPALFTAQLAESLNAESGLTISEAKDGELPQSAHVYIAPGGKQMRLEKKTESEVVIRIEESDPAELCKPSANILFNSAVFCASETLAVIMTGMGEDGYQGMKNLSAGRAYLMAQAADDCVIFGMPAKPIRDGIVHEIHAVEGLAQKISEYLR